MFKTLKHPLNYMHILKVFRLPNIALTSTSEWRGEGHDEWRGEGHGEISMRRF